MCIYTHTHTHTHVCPVDITDGFTAASCRHPRIDTLATARCHLTCRFVQSLLPGNVKDKLWFVNWIALLPEEHKVPMITRESLVQELVKKNDTLITFAQD